MKIIAAIILALSLFGCAITNEQRAALGAAADGTTTAIALARGAVESNPIMPTTPAGIVAITAGKLILVQTAEKNSTAERALASFFNGAAANNIAVIAGLANPVAIVIGLTAGLILWVEQPK